MEAFLPGLTQSQVKSGLRSYNPMEYTINIKGRLMDLSTPQVMGILNVCLLYTSDAADDEHLV